MKRVSRLPPPALLMILASGCASGNPTPIALANPGWTQLPAADVPAEDRIQWDRENFINYVEASRVAHTGAARRDARSGNWLWYAAAGFAAMGVVEYWNPSRRSQSDVFAGDVLASYGLLSAGFLLWGWHRKSNAGRRLKCMTNAREETEAFRDRWVLQPAPKSVEEWAAYRRDQDRIVVTLTCS